MTDTATAVAAAPFIAVLQPYLTATATAIVGGTISLAAAEYRRWTGVQVNAANLAIIQAAAATEAGKLVAAATDNFVSAKVEVHSEVVAAAADSIASRLPDVLKAAGVTTDQLSQIVTGEIGKLQARMTVQPATKAK